VRVWLALLATLPLLAVVSGATAGSSASPRNGLIAARGADAIYLIDAQRTKAWKVPGTVGMGEPTWSPDGSRLAVESWDESGSSVYTIRPDGSERRLVLRNASSPSWSPDGKRLVVDRDGCGAPYPCDSQLDGGRILVTVLTDGSDAHQVTFLQGSDPDGATEPVWSPDGKWIAFVGGKGAVKLVSPKGEKGGVRTIADSGWNLAWSPDASKLAFDTVDTAKHYGQQIVVLDLATGQRTTPLSRPNPTSSLTWSPDGKQLAFLASRPMPDSEVGGCGGDMPMDLWAMNADGSKLHLVSKGSYGQPSWGTLQPAPKLSSQAAPKPSSRPEPKPSAGPVAIARTPAASTASEKTKGQVAPRIASAATPLASRHGLIAARGRNAIYLIDAGSGNTRKIPGTAKMAQPAWSPDGSLLAVERAAVGGTSVYTITPDGGHPQLVLRNASSPAWSSDGKRLFAERSSCPAKDGCADDDSSRILMTVRPDGSDARPITFEEEDAYAASEEPSWPSDGNWIPFDDEGADSVSFDSSAAAWSPDGKQLAFVSDSPASTEGASGDASSGLWVLAADGGRPQLLATGMYGRPSWGRSAPAKSPSG